MNVFSRFVLFLRTLYERRGLLWELTKRDIKKQYGDTYLGIIWIYLQPLVFLGTLWFVFSIGLRGGHNVRDVPFIVYLSSGLICWNYFSGNMRDGAQVVRQYSFLLRKMNVPLNILPVVKILSSLLRHSVLMVFVIFIALVNGVEPSLYMLQLFYYLIAMIVFLLGWSWLASSFNVFASDFGKFVEVLTQLGFWFTPIFWNIQRLPEKYRFILKLNPAYYIVNGYRESLIYGVGFWEHPLLGAYFWGLSLTLGFFGAVVFSRLRPHFAEIL